MLDPATLGTRTCTVAGELRPVPACHLNTTYTRHIVGGAVVPIFDCTIPAIEILLSI